METKRFRNHYSSVLEKIATLFFTFFVIFVWNFFTDSDIEETESVVEEVIEIPSIYIAIGIGMFLLIIGGIIGYLSWVWSKTWIVLEDNAISVEKSTFTFSKNTLGIKDISNVNLEQNIFEMIIGTSKVKINTNSFSTASSTDLKIILKKKDAEALKLFLNERINKLNQPETVADVENKIEESHLGYTIVTSAKDVFLNSIFSTNIIAGIIVGIVSCGFLVNFINFIIGDKTIEQLLFEYYASAVFFICAAVFIAIVLVWNCAKSYMEMYNFSVKREGDKLNIKYGMLKKIEFSVPVDKINAIIIHQTFLARIFKRYSVELVNVGMGDENEEDTYCCLYVSKAKMIENIKNTLPEFVDAIDADIERQPKSAIIMNLIGAIQWMVIFSVIGGIVVFFVDNSLPYVVAVLGIIFAILIIIRIFGYVVDGIGITDDYCCIRDGIIARKHTIIKFDKIQYVTVNSNILTNKLGIVNGKVSILAMQGKNVEILPYIKEEKIKEISGKLIR